ncbi:response regulator [Trichocoleus sp. FACHB-90]|nr:response regulator [Trichocoleus sp. FACHB-90]
MKKILVIEDEAQTRDIYLECLEAEGFYTISAENGFVGVQLTQEHLPDLVICDIMMPELDGYGVLSTLRQNPGTATIPVIFLTAKTTEAERRYGMELGADDYLTKPCTAEDLLRAIANVCELTW